MDPAPSSRSASPANDNRASASAARAHQAANPRDRASATPASHAVLLPIPGSPHTTSTRPARPGARKPSTTPSSAARPASTGAGPARCSTATFSSRREHQASP